MKKLNKKRKNIFLGFGVLPLTIAPLATSFAMSTNTTTIQSISDFYNQVATSSEAVNVVSNNNTLLNKFINSSLYKNEHNWENLDALKLAQITAQIFRDSSFTDDEKINLTKFIQDHLSYKNIMNDLGFIHVGTIHQNQLTSATGSVVWTGRKSDNSIIGSPITINDQPIVINGLTGYNSDYDEHHPNIRELNISNQTSINYLIGTYTSSTSFNNLIDQFDNAKKELRNNAGNTLLSTLSSLKTKINDSLNSVFGDVAIINYIKSLSVFDILRIPDLSVLSNDNDAYRILLQSEFGKKYFTDNDNKISNFANETDVEEKNQLSSQLISDLEICLKALNNSSPIELDSATQLTNQRNSFSNTDIETQYIKFAKALYKYSNLCTQNVQLLIQNSLTNGDVILANPGTDANQPFSAVSPSELLARTINLDAETLFKNESEYTYRYQKLNQWGEIQGINKNEDIHGNFRGYLTPSILSPENIAVDRADSSNSFKMSLGLKKSNVASFDLILAPLIWLTENDHDNDGAIKNTKTEQYIISTGHTGLISNPNGPYPVAVTGWIPERTSTRTVTDPWTIYFPTNSEAITWTGPSDDLELKFNLRFNSSAQGDQSTTFSTLDQAIVSAKNGAFADAQLTINNLMNGINPTGQTFEKTVNHSISVSLESLTFTEIRFNTYDDSGWDDTHSDNFRFSGVSAYFSWTIKEL